MTLIELGAVIGGLVPPIRDYVAASLQVFADRMAAFEAKHAAPAPDPMIAALVARVAVLEARPLGEKGEKGDPGQAGLTYCGVFVEGKSYDVGDVTTWAGSTWHCNEPTETKPGDGSKAWTLMVKRGRDGKDAK